MKKIGLMAFVMLISISAVFAQKIAVLEFSAGEGVSQSYADSLTKSFAKFLKIGGSSIVEQSQLEKALYDNGFKARKLSDEQKILLTKALDSDKIISGEVTFENGQYMLGVSAFDIKWKTDMVRDSIVWENWTDYPEVMKNLSKNFASKVQTGSLLIEIMMDTFRAQLGLQQQ